MKKAQWKQNIVKSCKAAGTYQPYFDAMIDTLAGILEKRDTAETEYQASGGCPIVEHTNQGGATNTQQNPLLRLVNDLNRDALTYWRDLGLTPAGLKKINDKALTKTKKSTLVSALKELS